MESLSTKSSAHISSLQDENEGLASKKAELQQFTSLLQDRAKEQATSTEKLEARLELHQRELETKTRETTELTGTVLTLREELATLRQSFTQELSGERQAKEAATRIHRELQNSARAESLQWQQDDAAHQLKARLLQSEIDNQKQEMVRHKQWAEETISAAQTRMSEQRQRYEERMLAEKEKADIDLRGSQERTRTAYAQLEVARTDFKHQLAEMQRGMDQSIVTVTTTMKEQASEDRKAAEARLATVQDALKECDARLGSAKGERDKLLLRVEETERERARAEAAMEQNKLASTSELAKSEAKLEAANAGLVKASERAVSQSALVDTLRGQVEAEQASHRDARRQMAEDLAGKDRVMVQMAENLKASEAQVTAIKQAEIRRFGAIEQAMRSMKTSSEIAA